MTDFRKIQNFMKIHPAGAACVDGRWTDIMQLIAALHNFVNVPKKTTLILISQNS